MKPDSDLVPSSAQKIEKRLQRIGRMRQFKKSFENRAHHVVAEEDITADSIRYCDAMIRNWEIEITSLREKA